MDRGEDDGLDDPADNPLPEEKPKIQVGRRLSKTKAPASHFLIN